MWRRSYRTVWRGQVTGTGLLFAGVALTWLLFSGREGSASWLDAVPETVAMLAVVPGLGLLGVGSWRVIKALRWFRMNPPPEPVTRVQRGASAVSRWTYRGILLVLWYLALLAVIAPLGAFLLAGLALTGLLVFLEAALYGLFVLAGVAALSGGLLARGRGSA